MAGANYSGSKSYNGLTGADVNRVPGDVKFTQQIEHDAFVGFVEISGRLIGQDELGLIDESARERDTLPERTSRSRATATRRRSNSPPRANGAISRSDFPRPFSSASRVIDSHAGLYATRRMLPMSAGSSTSQTLSPIWTFSTMSA